MLELMNQIEEWHLSDENEKIIEAIEGLSHKEKSAELLSILGRAYNNLANIDDIHYFKKALDVLIPLEDSLSTDHNWNFRMAYAYYYLNQELKAKHYFEKALEARPGDEDTLEFIKNCDEDINLPIRMKSFRERIQDTWERFSEKEEKIRELID